MDLFLESGREREYARLSPVRARIVGISGVSEGWLSYRV